MLLTIGLGQQPARKGELVDKCGCVAGQHSRVFQLLPIDRSTYDYRSKCSGHAETGCGVRPSPVAAGETLKLLARDRLVEDLGGWQEAPFPTDRMAWRATRTEHEEKGTVGLLLEMDPRLLDLLRNPDREDDRSADLQLAQG